MNRFVLSISLLVLGATAILLISVPVAGQSRSVTAKNITRTWTPARTPDGQPDLQGIWTNATRVPLERPKELGAKEFYTEEEAAENARRGVVGDRPAVYAEVQYDLSQFGLESGQQTLAPSLRTSLIVGPEGRIPPMTSEGLQRTRQRQENIRGHEFDGPENRTFGERCLLLPVGPPMLPVGYNSNFHIVQGPGYVAILGEMLHDVRIIPLDKGPHLPQSVRQWRGDPRGHWQGNTLVIDTTNFTAKTAFRGSTENLHVVERFTRISENTIMYEFTVDDPATWAKPWAGEVMMTKMSGPLFEYACHEGNYGMMDILSGARVQEQKAAGKATEK